MFDFTLTFVSNKCAIFCQFILLAVIFNNTKNILSRQLEVIKKEALHAVIIAYEPIWAIGTGQNAETSYINEILHFIKQEIKAKLKSSKDIKTIYGGSVNKENCKEIYSSEHVDGLLIGGASLDHNIFSTIYNLA